MDHPLLISATPWHFSKLLKWRGVPHSMIGQLIKVQGQNKYNNLIDINCLFSDQPMGDPVDRNGSCHGPYKYKVLRPFTGLSYNSTTLEELMAQRVQDLLQQSKPIHLFWSGGIDSTALVSAFLTHATNLDQLELVYTPFSLYENKSFFDFVRKKYPRLKVTDMSGRVYLDHSFPGLIVTGHGGDEFTASLDDSFYSKHKDVLGLHWKDFWRSKNASESLIDFSESWFALAGRPIETLFEARWWFYACCKSQYYSARDSEFTMNNNRVDPTKLIAFYDFNGFENYVWNDPSISFRDMSDYRSYKKFLREYTFRFYQDQDYLDNYFKVNSQQFRFYRHKKIELQDQRWIGLLEDGTVIKTPNLPLFSKKEFDEAYGTDLDYLFNVDTV